MVKLLYISVFLLAHPLGGDADPAPTLDGAGCDTACQWQAFVSEYPRACPDTLAAACPAPPAGWVIAATDLADLWPRLSRPLRSLLLARISGPASAATVVLLLRYAERGEPEAYWDALGPEHPVAPVLAEVILARLLDAEIALPEAYAKPPRITPAMAPGPLRDDPASRAWARLARADAGRHVAHWRALSRHENPWVASLGIAGLIAAGHQDEASAAMAEADAPVPVMKALVQDLLQRIDGQPAEDRLYAGAAPVSNAE